MIKANELRIGNLLYANGTEYCIEAINDDGCFGKLLNPNQDPDFIKGLEPIPLTEEWLLKFGFEKLTTTIYRIGNLEMNFSMNLAFTRNGYNTTSALTTKPISFVHQLQNLYFALTGEELTIKQ